MQNIAAKPVLTFGCTANLLKILVAIYDHFVSIENEILYIHFAILRNTIGMLWYMLTITFVALNTFQCLIVVQLLHTHIYILICYNTAVV